MLSSFITTAHLMMRDSFWLRCWLAVIWSLTVKIQLTRIYLPSLAWLKKLRVFLKFLEMRLIPIQVKFHLTNIKTSSQLSQFLQVITSWKRVSNVKPMNNIMGKTITSCRIRTKSTTMKTGFQITFIKCSRKSRVFYSVKHTRYQRSLKDLKVIF